MAKEELLEMRGQVVELLPNAMFRVKLDNDHEVLAHACTKLSRQLPAGCHNHIVAGSSSCDAHEDSIMLAHAV